MATPPKNLHDNLFHATLSHQRRARSVLRAHLEPWIADLLEDSPPKPLDGSFVDEHLRASQSDRLLKVTLKKGPKPAFVYALLEHKSYSDPGTALQIHKYKGRIRERYADGKADRLRALPPILPLVFYHGKEKWSAPRSLAEMVATDEDRLRALESSFGYYLRNLGALPPERLAADREARAGLLALRYSHHGEKGMEEKLEALPDLLGALRERTEFARQVVVYLVCEWNVRASTLSEVAERVQPGKGGALVSDAAQELIDKGKTEGKAEGRVEGKAEGRVEGKAEALADSLRQLLEHRFGRLPLAALGRIAQASASELAAWFKAALDASSLSEVFGEPALE